MKLSEDTFETIWCNSP